MRRLFKLCFCGSLVFGSYARATLSETDPLDLQRQQQDIEDIKILSFDTFATRVGAKGGSENSTLTELTAIASQLSAQSLTHETPTVAQVLVVYNRSHPFAQTAGASEVLTLCMAAALPIGFAAVLIVGKIRGSFGSSEIKDGSKDCKPDPKKLSELAHPSVSPQFTGGGDAATAGI